MTREFRESYFLDKSNFNARDDKGVSREFLIRREVRRNHRGRFGGRFDDIIEGGSAGGSAKS